MKGWHRCLVCQKVFEREETWLQHVDRHETQRLNREKRLRSEDIDQRLGPLLPRATEAPVARPRFAPPQA
ncbi:hypothetical protein SDRG_01750 [Saprolegnia diclina VS20]|uniref:C2H2-type domain-containing protein n=1 Tax=Saprolegnia diclina (strain VS20) TaxID=1156394 RepID=T0SCT0_SAPDV|nr:hypothetical protein SDRG_01750 [Saprolegnia diclina VS20]EQC40672.1 hypothetical protein SDRG_01750 [Saprolegnia diclina VS20]|eukprot:XP_008605516.1 hypothetical protein SDRG_01750 [Saprolegnia diclina VS20]